MKSGSEPTAASAATRPSLRERQALKRVQFSYNLVSSLSWFATVLPMAVAILFAQSRGFTLLDVGLFSGLYALTVAVLEVPTGGLADLYGRKRMTLLSYLLAAVATTLFLFTFSMPMLLGYAVVNGAARALGSGALQAWFVDAMQAIDPRVDLQPKLAFAGTFELLALALGTLAGSFLPMLFGFLPSGSHVLITPLSVTLVASVAVRGIAIALAIVLIREVRTNVRDEADGGATSLRETLRHAFRLIQSKPIIALLLSVEAISGFALMGLETFWQPFFAARLPTLHDNTWLLGVIISGSFVMGMIGNLVAIAVSVRFGRRYALVAALFKALQCAAMVLLALQNSLLPAMAFFWLSYLALASANSPQATLLHAEVPASSRSVMLSVQSLASFTGSFAGSLLLGFVAEQWSVAAAWSLAGGLLLFAVFLLLRVDSVRPVSASQSCG